jgi:hypothetical protein
MAGVSAVPSPSFAAGMSRAQRYALAAAVATQAAVGCADSNTGPGGAGTGTAGTASAGVGSSGTGASGTGSSGTGSSGTGEAGWGQPVYGAPIDSGIVDASFDASLDASDEDDAGAEDSGQVMALYGGAIPIYGAAMVILPEGGKK